MDEMTHYQSAPLMSPTAWPYGNCQIGPCAFPSSLCVSLHPGLDLSLPSASPQTSPCFCVFLCVSSRPQEDPKGLAEEDWGCGALSSYCGSLWRTWQFLKQVRTQTPSSLSFQIPGLLSHFCVSGIHWTSWRRVNLCCLTALGRASAWQWLLFWWGSHLS